MSTELRVDQKDTRTAAVPSNRPEVVPLEKVIEAVRRDSRSAPEEYLEETVAKFGGE